MRDNYTKLKRAFMAFDKRLDGFVSIEDLKAILSNFTIPMSDQLFGQLMTRLVFYSSRVLTVDCSSLYTISARLPPLPFKPNNKTS